MQDIREYLARPRTIEDIVKKFSVSERTAYRWLEQYPDLWHRKNPRKDATEYILLDN